MVDSIAVAALKKPERLTSRLSHKIGEIIPEKYKNKEIEFSEEDTCLLIMNDLEELAWKEIKVHVNDGAGKLVIGKDGKSFYAETETEFGSPSTSYAGKM